MRKIIHQMDLILDLVFHVRMRKIIHQMELILISSFPCNTSHKMNPIENEELTIKRQYYLKNGFDSREIKSIYLQGYN